MTRYARPRKPCGPRGCGGLLFLIEPMTQHSAFLKRPDTSEWENQELPGVSFPILERTVAAVLQDNAFGPFRNRLSQVHLAAKDGIVFNGQAQGADIAFEVASGT
jgi:hypothetical protein